MTNELGNLISAECTRAEKDFDAFRSRGASVLTASGGLVTLLGAVLALAVGKDEHLVLDGVTGVAAIAALLAFVVAAIFVLTMYAPFEADAPKADELATYADKNWSDTGWDQQAAKVMTIYLKSMRVANGKLGNRLLGAIVSEVIGIGAVALMALSLVFRA